MLLVDFNFFYKYSVRQILLHKLVVLQNRFCIPQISKLVYFFNLTKIEDLDDVQIYNYIYLFKYFFGKRAYLTRIKSFFNVGKWTYSLTVVLYYNSSNMIYHNFFFFLNDLYLRSESLFVKYGNFSSSRNIYYIILKDLTLFSERKTNLGLFYLQQPLNLHIFYLGCDTTNVKHFFRNLKMR